MTAADTPHASQGDAAAQVLRREGRSFHWAARFLPAGAASDAAVLYAFCRMVDDLGDETEPHFGRQELDAVQGDLARGESRRPAVARFLEVAARRGVPLDAAQALIDGVRQDLANPVLMTEAEVIRYGYRVAGTVGLMMCPILGVRAAWAHPFAIDLGIAMQLTNIARDVIEDARRGRRYLPAALIDGDAPTPDRLAQGDPAVAHTVYTALRRLLDLAEAYYRSADRGMAAIPPRPRLAIITARRVYAGIGERIRHDGSAAYWRGRTVVGPAGKLRRTAQACVQFAQPKSWPKAAPPRHESALHAAIADLPGADVPGAASTDAPADAPASAWDSQPGEGAE